ncbi:MAG: oligosaccharide flippase family protein [Acutalibacteraceae bacterium]|nr:oligosaccharide flippase family protein [Acutalibacteraceae bacterium]
MAKSQLKAGAILSYLNMAIGTLIPMFYTPVMLDMLGQSEYGLFKLASTVTSYLSLLSFGIGSAVVRYLIMYRKQEGKEGEAKMFGLFNVIFGVISVLVIVGGIILSLNVGLIYGESLNAAELSQLKIMVFLLAVSTAISITSTVYTSCVLSHERFMFLQVINILTSVIVPVANLIALFMGFKSVGMVISSLIITIIVRVVYTIYVKSSIKIKPIYKGMPTHILKEILVFSFWVFLGNIVNQLYAATDTMIIGAIPALATVGVAVYNIGATFNSMMLSFATGVSSVITPRINDMVFSNSNNKELTDILIKFGRLQSYIVTIVCGGFIAFGYQFITLWAGADYGAAYPIAIVTMIPSCIPLMQSVALNIAVAQNKHKFRSIVYLCIAVVNVIGTILVVNKYGIIGAAVVSGIAYVIGQGFVMNWYYWKKINLDIPRFWFSVLRIMGIGAALCAVAVVVTRFIDINNWVLMFVCIIAYTVIFFMLEWCLAMNDYEKELFRAPVNKILRKLKIKKS